MAAAILAEACLALRGIGLAPGTFSCGEMLTVAQTYINIALWLAVPPGIAIFLAVHDYRLPASVDA